MVTESNDTLTVEIESPLTVSPAVVSLGSLKSSDESERRVAKFPPVHFVQLVRHDDGVCGPH